MISVSNSSSSISVTNRAAERGGQGGNLPQGLRYSGAPNARSQCSNGPGWGPLLDRYAPGLNLSLGGPGYKQHVMVKVKG